MTSEVSNSSLWNWNQNNKKNETKKRRLKTNGTGWKFTEKNISNHPLMTCGKTLSTVSISFENRFNMRPSGVVSNNSSGQRSTFINKLSCIACADTIKPIDTINEIATLNKTIRCVKNGRKRDNRYFTIGIFSFLSLNFNNKLTVKFLVNWLAEKPT